ncbi:MAG TPA: PIN domain-containing protein [Ktedonobacteraceae bacterium]|nr:PIN domain-containing protein [Ktedonobacteraceae bacterium]
MPDLTTLPGGTSVFVDTNVFHYHYQGKSISCSNFINRVAQGEVEAYVNTQVLSDLLHHLMCTEVAGKLGSKKIYYDQVKNFLRNQHGQEYPLKDYQAQFEYIIATGLHVLPINENLLVDTIVERQRYYLMTGDSLHLGTMNRRKIKKRKAPLQDIVTYDADFDHIPGLTVWKPSDVTP